jgi:mRNA-degrading endonuclease toxin of MazEF toxin-antitoxin module
VGIRKKNQLGKLTDILVHQVLVINSKRLISRLGQLTKEQQIKLRDNLRIILGIKYSENSTIDNSMIADGR